MAAIAGGPGVALAAPQTLKLANPQESAWNAAATEILQVAYRKLDIDVEVEVLPLERALQLSNGGTIDGEVIRVEGLETDYPNLRRIPVVIMMSEQMAFARDPDIVVDGWQSLKPYKLVFQRGFKAVEYRTAGMNVELVSAIDAGFRMVAAGRMDIAIATRIPGEAALARLKLDNVHMLRPPIEVVPLYHYLNVRHDALVPQITEALARMEAEGEIDAIRRKHGVAPIGE